MFNGANPPVELQLKYFYDVWGTDKTYNHMAVGWAWAFDTPFSWTKQIVSHFGGTRQGMAISWPKVIKDKGGIRNQFHHVIDVVPTILEAARHRPARVRGRHQAEPDRGRQHDVHLRQEERGCAVDPQDAVLRDVRRPRDLPRGLDREHQGHASRPGIINPPKESVLDYPWELYDLNERLDAVRRRRRQEPGQAEGAAGTVLEGGGEVPGAAARRLGHGAAHHAAAQPHRRPQRVHLDAAAHRHPQRRRAEHSQQLVHLQGRGRGPAGRRRRHADHAGRPLRRLRLLPGEEQAGLHSGTWST